MASPHPLLRKHREEAKKDILAQIAGLKAAVAQVDTMLTGDSKSPTQPAPTPKPEGKPDLDAMARELAATG